MYIEVSAISGHSILFSVGALSKDHAPQLYHEVLNLSTEVHFERAKPGPLARLDHHLHCLLPTWFAPALPFEYDTRTDRESTWQIAFTSPWMIGATRCPLAAFPPGSMPEEVARRELVEEVDGTASEPRYIGQFYTSNGISNEIAYVYLATGVELGEPHREATELMEMRLVPVEEALRMAREGEITDGPSALALLWCEPVLCPAFRASSRV